MVLLLSNDIVIQLPRCIVVLKQDEVMDMLKQNPVLWAIGLKRGKGLSRFEKAYERKPKEAC
jgi:hypothetical protein